MNEKLLVSLESPQHGFMSLRLKAGGESFVTVVSHTPYDSLRDLVEALSAVLDGDCEVTVKWNSEPEEYDFDLSARGDYVRLSVIHYPDHRRAVETGSRVFSFEGLKSGVCGPFWKELRGLRSRTLQDEFDRQWRREFPERELNELTKRIEALKSDV
jgi:hypothetical protein